MWHTAVQIMGAGLTTGWQHPQQAGEPEGASPGGHTGLVGRQTAVHMFPCGVAEAPRMVLAARARATKIFIFLKVAERLKKGQ